MTTRPVSARAPSVLLVGDHAAGVGFVLRRQGYQVGHADDGEAALAMARADRPQLVVIGLETAADGVDAWLTAARIRAEARRMRIIVVAPGGRIARDRAAALGYGVLSRSAPAASILAEVARQARFRSGKGARRQESR
jgi:DNA-binding response OmpR family regulator